VSRHPRPDSSRSSSTPTSARAPRRPPGKSAAGFWATAEPDALLERLADPGLVLTAEVARLVRDRAAAFLVTDPSRARGLARALFAAAERAPQTAVEARAHAWRARAEADMYSGRLPAARASYERATQHAERSRARQLLGEILVGRVHLLSLLGEGAEATRLAGKAERIFQRTGDRHYLAKLYINRGNVHYQRDEYAQAEREYAKAVRQFEHLKLRDPSWAILLMNRAIACANLSRVDEAYALFLQCERECGRLGLQNVGAQASFNRASLAALRGDFRAALALLESAGATFEQQGIADMVAAAQRARAEIHLELGMTGEAAALAAEAAAGFARQQLRLDETICRLAEARAKARRGDAAEAVPLLEKAADFFRRRRGRARQASTLVELAWTRLEHEPAQAAVLARRALRLVRTLPPTRVVSEARRALAEALLRGTRPRAAQRALEPALRSRGGQPGAEQMEVLLLAGRIARALGDVPGAERRLREAAGGLELQRRLIPGVELRARAFDAQVRIYHELLDLELDRPRPRLDRLLALTRAGRAWAFRERMAGPVVAAAHSSLEADRILLGSLTRRLEEAELPEGKEPDPGAVRRLRNEVRAVEHRLTDRLRRAEPVPPRAGASRGRPSGRAGARPAKRGGGVAGKARRTPSVEPASGCGAAQRSLRPDEALLEYFLLDDRVLALLLRPDGGAARTIPIRPAEIEPLLDRFQFQVDVMAATPGAEPTGHAFRRRAAEDALQALHAALVAPISDLLPPSGRLLVAPHGRLHRVPFECLHDGAGYLADRLVISRIPSSDFPAQRRADAPGRESAGGPGRGPAATWEQRDAAATSHRGAIIVSGTIASGPPAVAAELDAVAGCFPPRGVRVLRDASTKEILALLPRARLLHLCSHGAFREDNPLFSRLSTGDGALFVADVLERRLQAELVVLSACNTGRVFAGRGDDLAGVAHAFLAAGARHLIASLWRVHDSATVALMSAFYRHYRGDARGDPPLALARAGRDLREEWNHPFYWGSFSAHGA